MKKKAITIHHTGTYAKNDTDHQFYSVDRYHESLGFPKSSRGNYMGYHYFIERDGTLKQAKEDGEKGAHNNATYLSNYTQLGIAFAGNMSQQRLTDKQIVTAVKFIREFLDKNKLSPDKVKPHRYYKSTQCPGNNLPDKLWEYLEAQYEKLMHDKEPSIVKWHKKHKIIEHWNSPVTPEESKLAWVAYKLGKAIIDGELKKKDFNL